MSAKSEYVKAVEESLKKRNDLTKETLREIRDIYDGARNKLRAKIERYERLGYSDLTIQYAKDLEASIRDEFYTASAKINTIISKVAEDVAYVAGKPNADFAKRLLDIHGSGLKDNDEIKAGIEARLGKTSREVAEELMGGKIYKDGRGLSSRIWYHHDLMNNTIRDEIVQGLAEQISAKELASRLGLYVDADATSPTNWGKVYPGSRKKVDYNAMRLARTSINHAYQTSMNRQCKENPFIEGIRWRSVFAHDRTCELCQSRHNVIYDFKKNPLPLDHPNGMCYFEPVIEKSMEDIGSEIRAWTDGGSNKALDKWFRDSTGLTLKGVAGGGTAGPIKPVKADTRSDIERRMARLSGRFDDGISNLTANAKKDMKELKAGILKQIEESGEVGIRIMEEWLEDALKGIDTTRQRGGKAWYMPSSKQLVFSMQKEPAELNKLHTFFHEVGHFMDNHYGTRRGSRGGYGGYVSQEQGFSDLLLKEVNKTLVGEYNAVAETMGGTKLSDGDMIVTYDNPNVFKYGVGRLSQADRAENDIRVAVARRLKKRLGKTNSSGRSDVNYAGVSDIFGGSTNNTVKGDWGHKDSYWVEDREAKVSKEAWAEFTEALYFPETAEIVKDMFPESYEFYLKKIEECSKQ